MEMVGIEIRKFFNLKLSNLTTITYELKSSKSGTVTFRFF